MLRFRLLYLATIAVAGCAAVAHAQCATVYTTMAPDGAGHMHAVTTIVDNNTNPNSACRPSGWGTSFQHTYRTSMTIKSPSGRSSSNSYTAYAYAGTGTATVRTDDFLDLNGESGTFRLDGVDTITCTVAGLFFTQALMQSYTLPAPIISSVVDSTTNQNSVPIYAQGQFRIVGAALTAGGVSLPPILDASDDTAIALSLSSPPAPTDTTLYASYGQIGPSARVGSHDIGLTTAGGHAKSSFTVIPDVRVTPGPTAIMAFTQGPDPALPQSTCVPITASGDPSGGTYAWSTTSPKVSLTNVNTSTVTVCSEIGEFSSSPGDIRVTVVYSKNGYQSAPSATAITISKPTALLTPTLDALSPGIHTCIQGAGIFSRLSSYYPDNLVGARYSSYVRDRAYQMRDHLAAIITANVHLFESYLPSSQVSVGSGSGATVTDYFAYCSQKCRQTQADSLNAVQSIYANNFLIGTKNVTWSCIDAQVQ